MQAGSGEDRTDERSRAFDAVIHAMTLSWFPFAAAWPGFRIESHAPATKCGFYHRRKAIA
jgi:hypothetical protein